MVGSVAMLLHARECRYYAVAALLSVLVVDAHLRLRSGEGRAAILRLALFASLLFNSFPPGHINISQLFKGVEGIIIQCAATFPDTNLCMRSNLPETVNKRFNKSNRCCNGRLQRLNKVRFDKNPFPAGQLTCQIRLRKETADAFPP